MIKICKSCGEEKQMARYQKESGGKFYFRKYCIQCWSKEREQYQVKYRIVNARRLQDYHREKHASKKEQRNANARRYYAKLQDQVFRHYGHACACCGEKEKHFLTLDHKNNDGASHRKKIGMGHIFYRWIIDNNYPDSIQLMCYNCNAGKYRNGGVCPHHNTYKSQDDFVVTLPWMEKYYAI